MSTKYVKCLLAAYLLSLILTGCSHWRVTGNAPSHLVFRLAETQCSKYPSTQAAREFARLVEHKSGGRITVKVYDSGRLGDENSVVEQIQFGGIDLARVSLVALNRYSPKVQLATLPYMFTDPQQMRIALEGTLGEQIRDSLRLEKIACLSWYEGGARSFYTSIREISRIEDLRGLKIRVSQNSYSLGVYSDLGIMPISLPLNDVFMMLKTGAIDGAEDNMLVYFLAKHYELAKYVMIDESSRIPEIIIASRAAMMQLSKSDQAIIEQAAKESAIFQRKVWAAMERDARKSLTVAGVRIADMDGNSKKTIFLAAKPYYQTYRPGELDEPEN